MKVKMSIAGAAALLLASFQASATPVEVATGDWSDVHWMKNRTFNIISGEALDKIHGAFASGECSLPGQSKNRIDLKLPFLVKYGPDGSLQRLVLRKLGCPSVEAVLGAVLLQQVQRGDYRPVGFNEEGWYRSELHLSSS